MVGGIIGVPVDDGLSTLCSCKIPPALSSLAALTSAAAAVVVEVDAALSSASLFILFSNRLALLFLVTSAVNSVVGGISTSTPLFGDIATSSSPPSLLLGA